MLAETRVPVPRDQEARLYIAAHKMSLFFFHAAESRDTEMRLRHLDVTVASGYAAAEVGRG